MAGNIMTVTHILQRGRNHYGDGMRRRFATRRNGFERVDKAGYPGAVAGSKCRCSVLLMTNQC